MNKIIQWFNYIWNLRTFLEKLVKLIEDHKCKIDELIEEHRSALQQIAQTKLDLQAVEDAVMNPFSTMTVDPMEDAIQRSRDDRGLC